MDQAKQSQRAGKKPGDVPPEAVLAIEQFVRKIGGIDKARLAIETLKQLRKAA